MDNLDPRILEVARRYEPYKKSRMLNESLSNFYFYFLFPVGVAIHTFGLLYFSSLFSLLGIGWLFTAFGVQLYHRIEVRRDLKTILDGIITRKEMIELVKTGELEKYFEYINQERENKLKLKIGRESQLILEPKKEIHFKKPSDVFIKLHTKDKENENKLKR